VDELLMHRDLMKEHFSAVPTTFAHTDYPITPATAEALAGAGIEAAIIEGGGPPAPERDPNHTYTYRGLPVLVTHCDLADDIAVRFPWREWDRWPLMADRYAKWLAVSPGDCITLFLDYRIFGDVVGPETGILEFLHALPAALAGEGITTVHPSEAARIIPPRGDIGETGEPGGPQRTILQQSALEALEEAGGLVADRAIWRCLLETDHIRRMAMRSASCGKPHHAVSHQATYDYFTSFMQILSHAEERSAASTRSPKAALSLRCVPPDKAFSFSSYDRPAGYAAHSLQELTNMLEFTPDDVIRYHVEREDFYHWIDQVIGDTKLAEKIRGVDDRSKLRSTIQNRIDRLWKRLR
jgi:alpha-amylase